MVIMVIIVNNGFFPYGNNGNDYGWLYNFQYTVSPYGNNGNNSVAIVEGFYQTMATMFFVQWNFGWKLWFCPMKADRSDRIFWVCEKSGYTSPDAKKWLHKMFRLCDSDSPNNNISLNALALDATLVILSVL